MFCATVEAKKIATKNLILLKSNSAKKLKKKCSLSLSYSLFSPLFLSSFTLRFSLFSLQLFFLSLTLRFSLLLTILGGDCSRSMDFRWWFGVVVDRVGELWCWLVVFGFPWFSVMAGFPLFYGLVDLSFGVTMVVVMVGFQWLLMVVGGWLLTRVVVVGFWCYYGGGDSWVSMLLWWWWWLGFSAWVEFQWLLMVVDGWLLCEFASCVVFGFFLVGCCVVVAEWVC